MGRLGRFLRAREGRGGGKLVIDNKAEKAKFAEEIRQEFDPVERAIRDKRAQEELILKSAREPSPKEVLEELTRQCERLRKINSTGKLVVLCGGYAFELLSRVRSYPEVALGLEIRCDRLVPPWDTVVMFKQHLGKAKGGIL